MDSNEMTDFKMRTEFDKASILDRMTDLERRMQWLEGELYGGDGTSLTSRYTIAMIESLEDELHAMQILMNVMRRRQRLLD